MADEHTPEGGKTHFERFQELTRKVLTTPPGPLKDADAEKAEQRNTGKPQQPQAA